MDWRLPELDAVYSFEPEMIIHLSAMADIDKCQMHPPTAWEVNFLATQRLVDVAGEIGSRFVYISSDVVFDGSKGDYEETDSPLPVNIYAETKLAAEETVGNQLQNYVILRPALFYGKSLQGRRSFTETMLMALREKKHVSVYEDQIRTPLLVDDLAAACWKLANSGHTGLFHLGGPEKLSRYEMGEIACELFHLPKNYLKPVQASRLTSGAPRPADCSLNSAKIGNLLEISPLDFRKGLLKSFAR